MAIGELLRRIEQGGLDIFIDFVRGAPSITYRAAYEEAGALLD